MSGWTYLFLAILSEILASSALKASQGFSRFLPSLVVVGGYGLAFYFLSLSLKTVPLSLAYAVWAGVGTLPTQMAPNRWSVKYPSEPAWW